jgi:hypothetical protein
MTTVPAGCFPPYLYRGPRPDRVVPNAVVYDSTFNVETPDAPPSPLW